MPTSASSTFEAFFQTATGGIGPYRYQDRLAAADPFPEVLDVPTGLGKTAAVTLAWLWRRRCHPDERVRQATPRRLVYCLPMRVLVEQTFGEAVRWLYRLGWLDALLGFDPEGPDGCKGYQPRLNAETADKVAVHLLMGGEPRRDWDLFPERDAILIGTQDMLLSRALNRGYGMRLYRWPMHYGLLNSDCQWVFDEIQLMSTGLATSTQLQAFRERLGVIGPGKSVWMSATLIDDWLMSADFRSRVEKGLPKESPRPEEYQAGRLRELWQAEKPLTQACNESGPILADAPRAVSEFVANAHILGSLTLVVVNTVDRSRQVYEGLRYLYGLGQKPKWWGKKSTEEPKLVVPDLKLIHSRFRPREREQWMSWLMTNPGGHPGGRIIVSTQVVEAGVDLSARTLITELAPWPSLVQRFGRCNRRGEFGTRKGIPANVYWINARTPDEKAAAPYSKSELDAARVHIGNLQDVGLRSLSEFFNSLSDAERKRLFPYKPPYIIKYRDFVELFDTTPDLGGNEIDVSLYIRDTDELDVQVFWRPAPPPRGRQSKAAVRRQAPRREELCPVPVGQFRDFLKGKKKAFRFDPLGGRWQQWGAATSDAIRPGQVFWVPADQGGYDPGTDERAGIGWDPTAAPGPHIPIPPSVGSVAADTSYDADDESETEAVWQTIAEHTDEVIAKLDDIIRDLPLADDHRKALRIAARWHDWGKAFPVFQNAILRRPPAWIAFQDIAKAPDGHWGSYRDTERERPHFRHELASAIGVLSMRLGTEPHADWTTVLSTEQLADLAVYLIAAHHGKVRLSIRSLPGETPPPDASCLFARGVWDGERLPGANLCRGLTTSAVRLDLSPMFLGAGLNGHPSWAERMFTVRGVFGPLTVAYLETLLRAADMRASRDADERAAGRRYE